jgi:hypothetical protein
MTKFLAVKEAAKLVGKSSSSIRRILYPILENDRHPDRYHIEPTVAAAKALRVKGDNFAWKISEELLRREVPNDGTQAKADNKSASGYYPRSSAIIDILRKQLDIKDQQISAQNDVIKGLLERVRKGNILMGALQQQLSPPEPANRNRSTVVECGAGE